MPATRAQSCCQPALHAEDLLAVQVLTEFASAYGARPADDRLAEEVAAGDVSAIATLFLQNQR